MPIISLCLFSKDFEYGNNRTGSIASELNHCSNQKLRTQCDGMIRWRWKEPNTHALDQCLPTFLYGGTPNVIIHIPRNLYL
jgi:hypothetical protein